MMGGDPGGTNSYHVAHGSQVKIPTEPTIAIYQKLAPKIKEMKALGMSYREIARSLGIDKKTIGKALAFRAS
jgi:hypothetical protein